MEILYLYIGFKLLLLTLTKPAIANTAMIFKEAILFNANEASMINVCRAYFQLDFYTTLFHILFSLTVYHTCFTKMIGYYFFRLNFVYIKHYIDSYTYL